MRALVITGRGGPEVLQLQDRPMPVPSRGEVRVRVRATAVNRADLLQRMGLYPAPPDVPPDIPGLELAGEVEAIGADVTRWQPGDRVFGLVGGGSYAEYLVAHERTLAPIPDGITWTDAAAVPEAFITAHDALVGQGGMTSGTAVLVHAVGSGVGTAAVQLASALGAHSIGTSRTAAKLERASALGMSAGVHAPAGSFAREVKAANGGRGVDLVLELVGGPYLEEDLTCLAPTGEILLVGLMAGAKAELDLGKLLLKRLRLRGTVLRSRPLEERIATAQSFARHVVPLLQQGKIRPVIHEVLRLSDAAAAHRLLEANEVFGKVVLEV